MRAVSFVILLLSASTALSAPRVVIGVADVDGDATALLAVPLGKGEARPVGSLRHPRGDTPIGVLVDDDRLAVVMPAHGDLVLKHLVTGEEHTLATGLMRNQRPQLLLTPRGPGLVAVRAGDGDDAFDVVGIAPIDDRAGVDVLTSVTAGWLSLVPVAVPSSTVTASTALLSFDTPKARGIAQLQRLSGDGHVVDGVPLGTGSFRNGVARLDGSLLIEREGDDGHVGPRRSSVVAVPADARDLKGAQTVTTGLAGLSPIVSGARAAMATGSKDGSILVDVGDGRGFSRWPGARVGQARPQFISEVGGEIVVVVLVARGQQLPSELWALTKKGGRLLLAPPSGRVITVYGVSGAAR